MMKFQDLSTKTKILIGICSPMVLFVILGSVLANNINAIDSHGKAVIHTHKVLDAAADIVRSAVDMETGMRGYLLAGKEEFLGPYLLGEKKAYSGIDALRKVVDDNPKQVKRLNEMRDVLKTWQRQVTEPTIALRREIGDGKIMNDLARSVAKFRDKKYFVEFRRQINSFVQREEELLGLRHLEFNTARQLVDRNVEKVDQTAAWVNHTLRVLAATAELKTDAVDMETGMRGYLLTGNDDYLEPYNIGKQRFSGTVIGLAELVDDNPEQVKRLEKIRKTIEGWIKNVTEPAIQQRRDTNTLESISKTVLKKNGKQYLDSFRVQIAAFSEVEVTLMDDRQKEVEAAKKIVDDSLEIMSENEKWVSHTIQVIQDANAILTAAMDMETGMRGYLLAGREELLAPYTAGAPKFYADVAKLRATVRDNPDQVTLLEEAEKTIRTWQSVVTEPAIQLRREIGDAKTMDGMADLIGEAKGKKFFDQFRILMNAFEVEEYRLMALRQAASEDTMGTTYLAIPATISVALFIGGFLTWRIGNGIANPLAETIKAIEALAGEGATLLIPETGRRDEIGTLTTAFNSMAVQLDEKEVRVYKENKIRLEAEREAKRANQVKSDFLAAMSHEIRTPMAGVVGMADLIINSDLSPQQLDWATSIKISGENLLRILNGILDQSKLEAGKLELSPADFHLASFVKETTYLFSPKIEEKGLMLNVELDNALPVGIYADSMRIGQILSNLLSNALKFTEEGRITVRVEPEPRDRDDLSLKFIVMDSGIGLSKEAVHHLFTAFTQADNTTSRTHGGTGLGLSISKQLVEMMGGEIGVVSTEGIGSSFWFSIVYKPATGKVAAPDKRHSLDRWVASRPLKVLVAEDNFINQQIIAEILADLKHEVTVADDGKVAIELCEAGNFDFILMDIRMPVTDGLQATAMIRSMGPEKSNIPIIALTADIAAGNVKEYTDGGMNGVCAKPIDLPVLLKTINRVLGETIHTSIPAAPSVQKGPRVTNRHNQFTKAASFSQVLDRVSNIFAQREDLERNGSAPKLELEVFDEEPLAELTARYVEDVTKRCDAMKISLTDLLDNPLDGDARDLFMDAAQFLKGEGETFNYPLITTIAIAVHDLLEDRETLESEDVHNLSNHVEAISLIATMGILGHGHKAGRILLQGLKDCS